MIRFFVFFIIGVASRLIPHLPDATPLVALILFTPAFFSTINAFILAITMLLCSDCMLYFLQSTPLIGDWTFFSYTGWLLILLIGLFSKKRLFSGDSIMIGTTSSFIFWLWTNLGTWMTTTLYPHSASGLMTCYVAALPFLRNSMIATLITVLCLYCVGNLSNHKVENNICTR